MANIAWNGSVAHAGANITPLTELHAPNDPPEFDTTGSADTTHLHGTGKHKCQATMGFLGSQFPSAGTVVALTFTIGNTGASYANTGMPGVPALAFPTQVSISGRKDGRIEGNATLVPADTSISATTFTVTAGDLGFNGHAFSFAGTAFTGIVGCQYSGTCQAIDSTGAEASAPVATVNVPGIIDESITITTLGPPQCAGQGHGGDGEHLERRRHGRHIHRQLHGRVRQHPSRRPARRPDDNRARLQDAPHGNRFFLILHPSAFSLHPSAMPATSVNPSAYTGRVPTPADVVARYRVTLAYAGGLAEYHAAVSQQFQGAYQAQGLPSSVINSSAAIAAAGSYSFGRQMGNANYPNCISAALAWHKAIVTSATGATEVQP